VEHLLAEIWADVLGLDRVGIHDNFFHLGGHSLQVIRVINRMRKLGIELSAREMIQKKTIFSILERSSRDWNRPSSLAVNLGPQGGASVEKTLFCIHPGGGSVQWYMPLAERISQMYRLIGIQAAGLDKSEPPLSHMDDIASRYWEEVRAVQGDGPYLLLGWSYGAIVAQEMARRHPEAIDSLFLLEPPELDGQVRSRLMEFSTSYARAQVLWEQGQTATSNDRLAIEEEIKRIAGLEVRREDISLDEWLPFEALGLLNEAMIRHVVRPAPISATLFVTDEVRKAENGSSYSTGGYGQYIDYWNLACTQGVRVVDVPGEHINMISQDPSLKMLVRELERIA
ncbi:alpha/beta fold hydrolase, partial [Streptomyces olivaceoviridis]|uniref:thioesterase domain-containing protein n=1 Tax=Streptomyces olivaceoviridis TaxID=1921 RepID=UPI00367B7A22